MLSKLISWCVMQYICIQLLVSSNGMILMKKKPGTNNFQVDYCYFTKGKIKFNTLLFSSN